MTCSFGWFNDWWVQEEPFHDGGYDFVGPWSAVPYWPRDGVDYVHIGVAAQYVGGDEGTLQFRGRLESNVTWYYVDSGPLAGKHANQLSVETLWSRGPFFLAGDYARAAHPGGQVHSFRRWSVHRLRQW